MSNPASPSESSLEFVFDLPMSNPASPSESSSEFDFDPPMSNPASPSESSLEFDFDLPMSNPASPWESSSEFDFDPPMSNPASPSESSSEFVFDLPMSNLPMSKPAAAGAGQQRKWLLQRRYLAICNSLYLFNESPDEPKTFGHKHHSLAFLGKTSSITGNSCGGLVYLDTHKDKMIIYNPTTEDIKCIPFPPRAPPDTCRTFYGASGFGYDSKSGDYKVIKCVFHYSATDANRSSNRLQLYSLRSDSWTEIPLPPLMSAIIASDCVYVGGICYWRRRLGGRPDCDAVVWFDFATQISSSFSLPPEPGLVMAHRLVEFHGLLGAIAFEVRSPTTTRDQRRFQLWERRRGWWAKVFDVSLSDYAVTPVGLKDGRFLFLEGRTDRPLFSNDDHDPIFCPLLIYDWITKQMKKLDIYDRPTEMKLYSYVETTDRLPPSSPSIIYNWDWDSGEEETWI